MILTLVKINLTALFAGLFRRNRRRKKVKPAFAILIGLLAVYVVGAVIFTIGAMFYGFCAPLFDAGLGWFYFALAGILEFALCFIGGIFMVQAQIFSARDNELLLSMPIKPSAILAGRLSALLIIEYIFEALILIPVFAVLIMRGYISAIPVAGIIFFFLAAILLPLLALAAGCFVGWLVALASSHMRNKNLPTLILSIVFLAVYFVLYTRMMTNINMLIENGAEIAEAVSRAVFPAYHLGVSVTDGNALSFLIFAACAIIPFVAMCALLSASFVKLTTAGQGVKKLEYREKTLRVSGAWAALLKRELLHLWSLPMYILNAAIPAIATLGLAVVLIVRPGLVLDMFDPHTGALSGLIDPGLAGVVALTLLAVMNFVSAPSISLEGSRLWIVKSLPVTARDILLSKAGLHIVVCGIPSLIAGIVCIAVIPVRSPALIALTLVTPAAATVMFALLGVALNLTFPRFDWINPIQPVKQGISSMLSMFGGFAFVALLVVVYALLMQGALAPEIYMLLCTIVFAAASAGLYAYVTGPGSRRFEAL